MNSTILSRKKIDGSFERRFIIGLIVSDDFIKQVRSLYHKELLSSRPVVTIAEWCFKFFDMHGTAPSRHIQELFESEESKLDEEMSKFVEQILESLSDEYERQDKFNVSFLLSEAEKYFKSKSLMLLSTGIRERIDNEDVLGAEALFSGHKLISKPKGDWINPFTNEETIRNAFSEMQEPLFKLPGALGEMMNPQLTREGFIALLGKEKIGKSYWLMELAVRALRGRCNVAVFEVGDMTQNQWTARLHSYLTQRPLPRFFREADFVRIPVLDCRLNQDDSCQSNKRLSPMGAMKNGELLNYSEAIKLGYKACSVCRQCNYVVCYEERKVEPLTWSEAVQAGKQFFSRLRGGKQFRFMAQPNNTFRIRDIDNQLEVWKNIDDYVPDVVVVDYIDIAAPEDGRKEERNQHNDKWMAARRLSQKWKVLFLTASQADANSYEKDTLTMKNFSEDKRKHGHVTAEYALNQTRDEKTQGTLRISEIVIREGGLESGKQVTVGECRQIGRPYLFSYFAERES